MLPDSQQRAACTRGTTSPSLRLPPDFISSVSHSFGKFHPASLGCQGEAEGQEQGLCTPRSRFPTHWSRRPPRGSAHHITSARTCRVSLQPPPKQRDLFQFLLPIQVSHVPVPSCLLFTNTCVPSPAHANIRGKLPLVLMSTVTANTGEHGCTPALVLHNQHLPCIY